MSTSDIPSGLKPTSVPGVYNVLGTRDYHNITTGEDWSKRQYDKARRAGVDARGLSLDQIRGKAGRKVGAVSNERFAKQRRAAGIKNPMRRYQALARQLYNAYPDRYRSMRDVRNDPTFKEIYGAVNDPKRDVSNLSPEAKNILSQILPPDQDANLWY